MGLEFVAAFLFGVGLPAWWLGYLALLARPGSTPGAGAHNPEWYPVGRLVLWAACTNAIFVGATLLSLGTDLAGLQSALRSVLDSGLEDALAQQLENPDDAARLIDIMLLFLPGALAACLTLSALLNLWLAGRIVKISARLQRPWPRLSDNAISFVRSCHPRCGCCRLVPARSDRHFGERAGGEPHDRPCVARARSHSRLDHRAERTRRHPRIRLCRHGGLWLADPLAAAGGRPPRNERCAVRPARNDRAPARTTGDTPPYPPPQAGKGKEGTGST